MYLLPTLLSASATSFSTPDLSETPLEELPDELPDELPELPDELELVLFSLLGGKARLRPFSHWRSSSWSVSRRRLCRPP